MEKKNRDIDEDLQRTPRAFAGTVPAVCRSFHATKSFSAAFLGGDFKDQW